MPLAAPSYVEWLTVHDPAVAASTDTGRRVLAAAEAGGGLLAWTVLVDDIEAAADRVGVAVYAGTTRTHTGLLRCWWTVMGAPHLPILVAYEDPHEERLARWEGAFERAGHDGTPGGFTRIEVGGARAELDEWLGPHDLPVAVVDAPPGLRAFEMETGRGVVRVEH